jgi:hypothetical protein
MRFAHVGCFALIVTSGCLRVGYDTLHGAADAMPDAAQGDAGSKRDDKPGGSGGGGRTSAGTGGKPAAGSGGVAATAGTAGADTDTDGGADLSGALGDTGLRVSDILGFYSGNWGDMVLHKVGDEIWGVYNYSGGTIVGDIKDDGVFVGWWSQLPTRTGLNAGEVEFRWSQTSEKVIALDGRWRWGSSGAWFDNWDVDLATDREAPSALTARFDNASDFKRHP